MWETFTADAAATERLGAELGGLVRPGDVVLLSGDLGAGKTTFARGLGRGLGVREPVTSPTFTILHQYAGRCPVYHFDLYRWPAGEDLAEVGLPDFLYDDGVSVVEWPALLGRWAPREHLAVDLFLAPEGRRLAVRGEGERGLALEQGLRQAAGGEAGC